MELIFGSAFRDNRVVFFNTAYQIIAKIIVSSLGVVSTVLLTRFLGVTGFGEYTLVLTIAGFAILFADFGLGSLLTRELSKKRDSRFFATVFSIRVVLWTMASVVSGVVILIFPYSETIKAGVIVALVLNGLLLFSSTIWASFQAEMRFQKIAIAQVVTSVASLLLVVIAVSLQVSLVAIIGLQIIAQAAGLLVSIALLSERRFIETQRKRLITTFRSAIPFGIGVVLSVAYFRIDTIMLSMYFNPSVSPDVGVYSLAYRVFEIFLVFGGFYTQSLFPLFAGSIMKERFMAHVKTFLFFSACIAIVGTVLSFILARPLVLVIGGSGFADSIGVFQILSLALGASILSGFFLNIALSGGREKALAWFAGGAVVLNIVGNMLVIPTFSYYGVAWTTVLTQFFILGTNMLLAWHVIRMKKTAKA